MKHSPVQHLIHQTLESGNKIFFTSDIHGFHKNLCVGSSTWSDKSSCRQFADEYFMTNQVVDNINSTVGDNDILFHLGDFCFGSKSNIPILRNMIRCKNIVSLYGNHDSHINEYKDMFSGLYQYLEITINKTVFVLFHYPIASWNYMSSSIHLYGHCHGNYINGGKSMDVGLDPCGLYPISYNAIIDIMNNTPVLRKDHH